MTAMAHTDSQVQTSPQQHTQLILKKLGCKPADLESNRRGKISDVQMRGLFMGEIFFPGLTALLMLGVYLAMMAAQNAWVPDGAEPPVALRLGRIGALLGLMMTALRVPWRLVIDLVLGRVQVTKGRARHRIKEQKIKIDAGKEVMNFDYFEINGVTLPIKSYLLDVIDDVNPYAFYFTPRSKHLVAVEFYDPVAAPAQVA
jgi:hypothetical protein